jgi:hypothetical protein
LLVFVNLNAHVRRRSRVRRSFAPGIRSETAHAVPASMRQLSEVHGYLRDHLGGGVRISAVEFPDVSAKGESHDHRYESPAVHVDKHVSDSSKTG